MPKGSEELTCARKEEIVQACASLYKTTAFKNITIKDIAAATSFTRTSIYNYFQTKEEIFLALLQREYEQWVGELDKAIAANESMSHRELARLLAQSLEKREMMLKLLSMNLYDMEANSRLERLVEFKLAYGKSLQAVQRLLEKFCPQMTEEQRQNFIYAFFPFIYGIYPYTAVSQKQREAMEQAGIGYIYPTIYQLAYDCAKKLLADGNQ